MKKIVTRSAVVGAAAAAMLAGGLLTATPAHAGGPGSVHVEGATYGECQTSLAAAKGVAIGGGATITGEYNCFYNGSYWTGGFVAHY